MLPSSFANSGASEKKSWAGSLLLLLPVPACLLVCVQGAVRGMQRAVDDVSNGVVVAVRARNCAPAARNCFSDVSMSRG